MRLYTRWINLSQNLLLDVTNLRLFFLCYHVTFLIIQLIILGFKSENDLMKFKKTYLCRIRWNKIPSEIFTKDNFKLNNAFQKPGKLANVSKMEFKSSQFELFRIILNQFKKSTCFAGSISSRSLCAVRKFKRAQGARFDRRASFCLELTLRARSYIFLIYLSLFLVI